MGDQGLYSSKNSTISPTEITLILLLYLIVHKPHLISFYYPIPLGFRSITDNIDHVNLVIRLLIEHGINRGARASGLVKPEVKCNVNFEIKSQFMRELREETFFGNKNEDAHDHIDRVLNIVILFNIPRVSKDAVLLRVFPFTLTRSAKRWVDRLTQGVVNTWDLLKKAFIQRMTPTQALMAIQTIADHSQKWLDGTSSRNISSSSNTDGLTAVIRPHLDKECPLNEEVKQVEEVKYGEFGRPTPFNESNGAKFCVGPPGYYTRIDNQTPYGEKRPNLVETINRCSLIAQEANGRLRSNLTSTKKNYIGVPLFLTRKKEFKKHRPLTAPLRKNVTVVAYAIMKLKVIRKVKTVENEYMFNGRI
nr:hypothetical protein [Tanacetum cinerariifolium]